MPRLLLLRHAKSDWASGATSDFDRPLNKRGRKAAPIMGRWCADNGLYPQRIICSAALRTRQTLAGLLPFFPADCTINITRRLYEDDVSGYLEAVRGGGDAETLMLIGHNPSTQELACLLGARGDEAIITAVHTHYPTCGLAVIDIDAPRFADLVPGGGHLSAFKTPKDFAKSI